MQTLGTIYKKFVTASLGTQNLGEWGKRETYFQHIPLGPFRVSFKKDPTLFLLLIPEYFHHPLEKCCNPLGVTPLITTPTLHQP